MTGIDTRRFLLCRPEGGLNDMLCQVQKCYSYAKRWKRILIIDTNYTGSTSFKDKFSNYFNTKETDVYLDTDEFTALESMSLYPGFLQGRINTYKIEWNISVNNFVDCTTQQSLKLNFDKDFTEQVVLHHSAGGGEKSVRAFAWLRLNQIMLDELSIRIEKIGNRYTAIHIRHTDYKTDYKKRIQSLARKIAGPVYIASDNKEVIAYCVQVFGKARTHTFSRLPKQAGKRIHIDDAEDGLLPFDMNKDAIADLFTLALSEKLYFFQIQANNNKNKYSGFSRLAKNIHLSNLFISAIGGAKSVSKINPHRKIWTIATSKLIYIIYNHYYRLLY